MDPETESNIAIECSSHKYTLENTHLTCLAERICQLLGIAGYELNIKLVDNPEIHELNHKYRNTNHPTDVLAFPQTEWISPRTVDKHTTPICSSTLDNVLGDIVISLEEASQNAAKLEHPLEREVGFLITHGILHLCGHDHQQPDEEQMMIQQQQLIMQDITVQKQINCALIRKLEINE